MKKAALAEIFAKAMPGRLFGRLGRAVTEFSGNAPRAMFRRYIGIDYSGADIPTKGLPGLRVFMAVGEGAPIEILPPRSRFKRWSRRGVAGWLHEQLSKDFPTLVGIDHGFSFPKDYFDRYDLKTWPAFLEDFHAYWPTDEEGAWVKEIREGSGAARTGNSRWKRLTELRSGAAKSVFQFDVQGTVANSTHAGIPWLIWLRKKFGERIFFWPFDGWDIPAGRSAIVEVYPRLCKVDSTPAHLTPDQKDAFNVAAWLARADRDGSLRMFLMPELSQSERDLAKLEGWILGVN
jgi:hypothetical protein